MEEVYIGRQPILDRTCKTVAFELLYRSGSMNVCPEAVDGTEASSQVISNVFTEIGLPEISGGLPVFINFNRDMLLSDLPELNSSLVVIEILEKIEVDKQILEACSRLRQKGFSLALDDFVLTSDTKQLLRLASIIKIDWRADPPEHIKKLSSRLKPLKLTLLAEKIETSDEFSHAKELGFDLFQGYFFAKPEIIRTASVKPLSGSLMEIMKLLQDHDPDFEKIESIVSKDAALSLKLLKIINSASIALPKEVDSIRQAIVLLGQKELKRWLTLLLFTQFCTSGPAELLNTAFLRGLFGEKLAIAAGRPNEASAAFFTGLLSLIDTMLKCPMEKAIANLPIARKIKEALLSDTGPLGSYIALVKAYEKADKERINSLSKKIGVDCRTVVLSYLESLKESNNYRLS